MHVGRGQEIIAMGNSHGQSKFPKKWSGKDKQETQAGTPHAQQPSQLTILYFGFDLNCNVSNMQYIIHKIMNLTHLACHT